MISFIILHYKNITDTLECIVSIKKQIHKNVSIIVVDNGTLSCDEKKMLLKETNDVICNKENLGFAKGNNIGCEYAIKKYQADFLVVLNNDIVLIQNDFIGRIIKCYKKTEFDFMGPKIITNDGDSVNPFPVYKTISEIEFAIAKSEQLIKIYRNGILSRLLNFYFFVKSKIIKPKHLVNGEVSSYNVAVHGCCIIFSKKYYEKYKDVFFNDTFLYHEEEFLEYRRKMGHLVSYYDKMIEVFHKEGASLNYSFEKQERKKVIFRNEEILKSLKLLLKVIKNEKSI